MNGPYQFDNVRRNTALSMATEWFQTRRKKTVLRNHQLKWKGYRKNLLASDSPKHPLTTGGTSTLMDHLKPELEDGQWWQSYYYHSEGWYHMILLTGILTRRSKALRFQNYMRSTRRAGYLKTNGEEWISPLYSIRLGSGHQLYRGALQL